MKHFFLLHAFRSAVHRSRQRLLISRWGLNQKQSRWGATVMSPNPADCVKTPLNPQANVVDCGIKEGMVLEMTLIDPIDT